MVGRINMYNEDKLTEMFSDAKNKLKVLTKLSIFSNLLNKNKQDNLAAVVSEWCRGLSIREDRGEVLYDWDIKEMTSLLKEAYRRCLWLTSNRNYIRKVAESRLGVVI